jgi:hypothetical protein
MMFSTMKLNLVSFIIPIIFHPPRTPFSFPSCMEIKLKRMRENKLPSPGKRGQLASSLLVLLISFGTKYVER